MNFKFGRNIRRLNPSKKPLKISETRGRGRSQGLCKIFRAAIYRAHRVFAIAQLSCTTIILLLFSYMPIQTLTDLTEYSINDNDTV